MNMGSIFHIVHNKILNKWITDYIWHVTIYENWASKIYNVDKLLISNTNNLFGY